MAKTMKYEIIRNKLTLIILLGALGWAEVIFLFGLLTNSANATGLGVLFLMLGSGIIYFTVWLLGLLSFSKDLRQKSGYMVFLTPVNPYTIVFAKLIVALAELLVSAMLMMGVAALDIALLGKKFGKSLGTIRMLAEAFETTADNIWAVFSSMLISGTISVVTLYAIAYLGSALAAMVTRAGSAQFWVGVVIVIGILIVYGILMGKIPMINSHAQNIVWRRLIERIPQMICSVVIAVGSAFGTGYLLDKKISF